MRRVTGARRELHEHADPLPFHVSRERAAFNPGRYLLPFDLRLLQRAHPYQKQPSAVFGDMEAVVPCNAGRESLSLKRRRTFFRRSATVEPPTRTFLRAWPRQSKRADLIAAFAPPGIRPGVTAIEDQISGYRNSKVF